MDSNQIYIEPAIFDPTNFTKIDCSKQTNTRDFNLRSFFILRKIRLRRIFFLPTDQIVLQPDHYRAIRFLLSILFLSKIRLPHKSKNFEWF